MHAADTNVIVRLVMRDDEAQCEAVKALGVLWVSHAVFLEVSWVLGSVYGFGSEQLAQLLGMLASHESLVLEEAWVVQAALVRFRSAPKLGFADCLVLELARKAGHIPLVTFDRDLSRQSDVERIVVTGRK